MEQLNLGIIGTGVIAKSMAEKLNEVYGTIYGVTSVREESRVAFAKAYNIKNVFSTTEALLADPMIDAVYIATPHHLHASLIELALLAGKHVLCEKAITVTSKELEGLIALARSRSLILMEAMTIFHMPLFQTLKQQVSEGLIGQLKIIQVNFGSHKDYDPSNRFFNPQLAGGALLDIGGYAVSVARLFLSEQPEVVMSTVDYFETGVDETSATILKNAVGQITALTLSMRAKQPKRALIAGDKGYLEIYDYPRGEVATFTETASGKVREIRAGETSQALRYELLDFAHFVETGDLDAAIGLSLDVSRLLDQIRNQWDKSK
ncbi:MAG: Gfo/Idh/MocA family oxidoreductase [Streptococcaceae bacterium]|jgi:predicted dehydrogenase|nr:Gfo/Idh/MocA family oxidoreductase [Streptococcaceae bacterium]